MPGTFFPLLLLAATAVAQAGPDLRTLAPYDPDPDHPANRVFRAAFVVELVPTEVAAALPQEHEGVEGFFQPQWYFHKRRGEAKDRAWFGGDGRQMPRERFDDDEAELLQRDLAALDGGILKKLKGDPRTAVFLQHDVLRLACRLLDTKENPELLPPLLATAERLALPAATLRDPRLATFALADALPFVAPFAAADFVEIDRKSTRLFDAERIQMWSSLWLAFPRSGERDTPDWLRAFAAAGKGALPVVPIGTTAVLAQGIVALDDQGQPRATDVVVDVRVQRLQNRDPLADANPTTTRDGVDFQQWWLRRERVREANGRPLGLADFRTIPMTTPELFRDYGTLKHTTYAGQCSLCHRRSNGPDEELGGFSALRPNANPRPVATADARRVQAEGEFAKFLTVLRAAK